MRLINFLSCSLTCATASFLTHKRTTVLKADTSLHNVKMQSSIIRRSIFLSPFILLTPLPTIATTTEPTTAASMEASDLPPDAIRSYLQYRIQLQTAADYYLFELRKQISNIDDWGEVNTLFSSMNARGGQGQPSRIQRDFLNPMNIVTLSMAPDEADEMRSYSFKFEFAMEKIRKATAGIRRDLPVEISAESMPQAVEGWNEGRQALNSYFLALNKATGLKGEMKTIPEKASEYGRSERKFFDLKKKLKLCQNRGGPALSQAWGQLMVSGYLQDSCGIPDLNNYFFQ